MVEEIEEVAKRSVLGARTGGCMLGVHMRQHALRSGKSEKIHQHFGRRAPGVSATESQFLNFAGRESKRSAGVKARHLPRRIRPATHPGAVGLQSRQQSHCLIKAERGRRLGDRVKHLRVRFR